jgi:YidC/Oxa1 family membrane protein insertase
MFDRNTIIALVVVGIILLFLPKYYEWMAPPTPPRTETATPTQADTTRAVEDTPSIKPAPATAQGNATPDTSALANVNQFVDTTNPLIAKHSYSEKLVEIETPLFNMTIGTNGLVSRYELKNYTRTSGEKVSLHQAAAGPDPAIGLIDFDFSRSNMRSLSDLGFEASTSRLFVPSGSDSIILEAGNVNTKYIRLIYVFDAKRYGFDVSLETIGLAIPDNEEFNVKWVGGVPSTEPDPASDQTFSATFAQMGDELEEIQLGTDEKVEFSATGQTGFVATRSKYFIAAIIPQVGGGGADLRGINRAPDNTASPHIYVASLREAWDQGGAKGRWQVYWGPITVENLKAYNVGLENTMNWGWQIIKPFSRLTLWALTAMHGFIPNYGIVIIIFSIFVKIILWPLTRKSQISMKKMAALQPEIKALKEAHAKNPAAANKEMMALYKERGVNPAAGCIPILLQMPLLYALFIVFRATIEFRQAPFIGWISDLSLPDYVFNFGFNVPLYGSAIAILPIVMGISQFVMSKRSMTDPNQKMMIYIMPVFMTLIFNQFPSGLTLYYTLFNLLAIVEQNLIKVPDLTTGAVVEEKKSSSIMTALDKRLKKGKK